MKRSTIVNHTESVKHQNKMKDKSKEPERKKQALQRTITTTMKLQSVAAQERIQVVYIKIHILKNKVL